MKRGWTAIESLVVLSIIGILTAMVIPIFSGCGGNEAAPTSISGVKQHTVTVETGSDGITTEQRNVSERLKRDNLPGSIKHLYVISAYSGDVLIYSTVKGKVTSSSKRLSPTTVAATDGQFVGKQHHGMGVNINGRTRRTTEVIQDDGTYGSSIRYLFWFDSKDVYHQHYVTGGQIVHISDQPLSVPKVILNFEVVDE